MKMLWFVFYKEFLELKSDKGAIRRLVLGSVGIGLLFPAMMYLRHIGILPGFIDIPGIDLDVTEPERLAMMRHTLEFIGLLILPFFVSLVATQVSVPSIVQEAESRTLERLLSLPLSWGNIFFGKFLFHVTVSLVFAYITVLVYFSLSSLVVEAFRPPALATFLLVFIPAVIVYTVAAGLFVSARARSMKMANVTGGILTSAIFLGGFFVAQAMGVDLGREFLLTVSFVLLAIGLTLAYFTTRVNPEKLLYGRSS